MTNLKKEKKWITRPGKRIKTGKLPKAGGKPIINPEWLEDKYDVTIERRHGGIASGMRRFNRGGKVK